METRAGARIEPGKAAAQPVYAQLAAPQILDVYIRDLQFAAGRRFQIPRDRHNLVVINVKTGNRVIALGLLRFLLDGNGLSSAVEFHHAIPFGIIDMIAEDGRAVFEVGEGFMKSVGAIKDIVPEDERDGVFADE